METGYSIYNKEKLVDCMDEFFNEHCYCNGLNNDELTKEYIIKHNKDYDFPRLKHEWIPYGNNFDICYEFEDLL